MFDRVACYQSTSKAQGETEVAEHEEKISWAQSRKLSHLGCTAGGGILAVVMKPG